MGSSRTGVAEGAWNNPASSIEYVSAMRKEGAAACTYDMSDPVKLVTTMPALYTQQSISYNSTKLRFTQCTHAT